jgi:hypothetical protein
VLYALWVLYLRHTFGAFPTSAEGSTLVTPFTGWIDTVRQATTNVESGNYEIGEAAVPLIVAVGSLLVITAVRALRVRHVVDRVFLALAALASCMTPDMLLYPKDTMRELAPILALVPFVLGARARSEDRSPAIEALAYVGE